MVAAEPVVANEIAADPPFAGRALAFGVTWLSYGSYYLGRKGLSVAKKAMEESLGKSSLYGVETTYLALYCVGQWVNGGLGDRVGARRLIGFGMLVSAAACIAFGFSSGWFLFALAMVVNGLAQATGWPGNVKAMSEWTPANKRGATMGLWSTCYQLGGIAASAIATQCLVAYGSWRAAFVGPGVLIALVGLVVLALLRPGPLAPKATRSDGGAVEAAEATSRSAARKQAQRRVLRHPTVWAYGMSYFCIKLIRYSLIFWLPYYLETALHYTKKDAGLFSTSFEVGGAIGTVALGIASDRLRSIPRSVFAATSLVILAPALYLYVEIGGTSVVANFLAMALVGALLFGPDALLSGAAAQDVGGPFAAAMAAGVVNGIGSLGGVLQELVTREVSGRYGWGALFYVFVALSLLAALSLTPTLRPNVALAVE